MCLVYPSGIKFCRIEENYIFVTAVIYCSSWLYVIQLKVLKGQSVEKYNLDSEIDWMSAKSFEKTYIGMRVVQGKIFLRLSFQRPSSVSRVSFQSAHKKNPL